MGAVSARGTGRFAKLKRLGYAVLAAAVVTVPGAFPQPGAASAATAPNPAANLDQCQNGTVGPPIVKNPCLNGSLSGTSYSDWVNGNVNGSKAHWRESEFLTYRAKLTGLSGGNATHSLVFHYDTVHGGKHAIDYIGSFEATETTSPTASTFHRNDNNPCLDILGTAAASGCTSAGTAPVAAGSVTVPSAAQQLTGNLANCGGSSGTFVGSPTAGSVSVSAPTTAGVNAVSAANGALMVPSGTGQCSSSMTVSFKLSGTAPAGGFTVVLGWGGHIAAQQNWGMGNSATSISGSPYHMALDTLDGITLGSQDRALSTSAIFFAPAVTTTLSATSVTVGGSVHDSATLVGASANAGGTVTYTVYSDNTCATVYANGGTKTVTNSVVPNSDSVTFNPAGTYYWRAAYSGDALNQPATGGCLDEIVTVGNASPTISTTLSETTGSIGDSVHDSSSLSGATGNAGGTVTYSVYTDSTCSTVLSDAGTKTVTSGSVPNSDNVTFNSAGTYYWQAVYSGDANNEAATSPCTAEVIVIGKNSPTISTTLSATSVAIGTYVHDSSALTGATSDASGTVTYTVYTDSSCSKGAVAGGTKGVTSGVVADSDPVQLNSAGTYYWQAVYSGDANNNVATSPCTEEVVTVNKNSPSMTTAQNLRPNDSSTIIGATATATGTATFNLYSPSDATCSGTPAYTETVNVSGNGTYATTNTTFLATATGTWRWKVVYSGDSNNNGTTSACGVENFTITNG